MDPMRSALYLEMQIQTGPALASLGQVQGALGGIEETMDRIGSKQFEGLMGVRQEAESLADALGALRSTEGWDQLDEASKGVLESYTRLNKLSEERIEGSREENDLAERQAEILEELIQSHAKLTKSQQEQVKTVMPSFSVESKKMAKGIDSTSDAAKRSAKEMGNLGYGSAVLAGKMTAAAAAVALLKKNLVGILVLGPVYSVFNRVTGMLKTSLFMMDEYATAGWSAVGSNEALRKSTISLMTATNEWPQRIMEGVRALHGYGLSVKAGREQLEELAEANIKASKTMGVGVDSIAGMQITLLALGFSAAETTEELKVMAAFQGRAAMSGAGFARVLQGLQQSMIDVAAATGWSARAMKDFQRDYLSLVAVMNQADLAAHAEVLVKFLAELKGQTLDNLTLLGLMTMGKDFKATNEVVAEQVLQQKELLQSYEKLEARRKRGIAVSEREMFAADMQRKAALAYLSAFDIGARQVEVYEELLKKHAWSIRSVTREMEANRAAAEAQAKQDEQWGRVMATFANQLRTALMPLMEWLSKNMDVVVEKIKDLASGLRDFFEWLEKNLPVIQEAGKLIGGLFLVGPIIKGLGLLKGAAIGVGVAFKTLIARGMGFTGMIAGLKGSIAKSLGSPMGIVGLLFKAGAIAWVVDQGWRLGTKIAEAITASMDSSRKAQEESINKFVEMRTHASQMLRAAAEGDVEALASIKSYTGLEDDTAALEKFGKDINRIYQSQEKIYQEARKKKKDKDFEDTWLGTSTTNAMREEDYAKLVKEQRSKAFRDLEGMSLKWHKTEVARVQERGKMEKAEAKRVADEKKRLKDSDDPFAKLREMREKGEDPWKVLHARMGTTIMGPEFKSHEALDPRVASVGGSDVEAATPLSPKTEVETRAIASRPPGVEEAGRSPQDAMLKEGLARIADKDDGERSRRRIGEATDRMADSLTSQEKLLKRIVAGGYFGGWR